MREKFHRFITSDWETNVLWSLLTAVGSFTIVIFWGKEMENNRWVYSVIFLCAYAVGMVVVALFAAVDKRRKHYWWSRRESELLGLAGLVVKLSVVGIPALWLYQPAKQAIPVEVFVVFGIATVLYLLLLSAPRMKFSKWSDDPKYQPQRVWTAPGAK